MDPALSLASPFQHEGKALGGVLDSTMDALALPDATHDWPPPPAVDANALAIAAADADAAAAAMTVTATAAAAAAAAAGGTLCSLCGRVGTTAVVPDDGLYVCRDCVAQQRARGRRARFPAGTFRCCPTATTAETDNNSSNNDDDDTTIDATAANDDDGVRAGRRDRAAVLRCAGCRGWFHASCVGIVDARLRVYAALSVTRWYCPAPSCCERALVAQMRKR